MAFSIGDKAVNAMYIGTKKVLKAYIGSKADPFYKAEEPATSIKCTVTGLGNSSPTSVNFIKDTNFTPAGLGIEEITFNGDVFIKIPTMYRKVNTVTSNQITSFTIATAQVDNTYEPYSVFVDEDGNLLPYVLIGKYAMSSNSTANSVSGGSAKDMLIGTARTNAKALGTGYQIYDWQFQKLFQDLALVIGGAVNFQNGSNAITNFLGIYDLNRSIWVDGMARNGTSWVIATDPDNYVNNPTASTTGYTAVGYAAPSLSGYITALGYDSSNPFFNAPSSTTGGSSSTYYCDYYYSDGDNQPVSSGVGGSHVNYGLWYSDSDFSDFDGWTDDWLAADERHAARLCYRPINN